MDRDVGADEAAWRDCFIAARDAAPSEWSDFAVEIMTVLVMAGAELDDSSSTHDALLWFLRHRTDVLHEAARWAGMEMVTFRPTRLLGEYSNERALVALRSLRDELAG